MLLVFRGLVDSAVALCGVASVSVAISSCVGVLRGVVVRFVVIVFPGTIFLFAVFVLGFFFQRVVNR